MINNCIGFIQNLLPRACCLCQQPVNSTICLCDLCRSSIDLNPDHCQTCARPMTSGSQPICGQCLQRPPAYDQTFAPLLYQGFTRQLISQFKFSANLTSGKLLADLFLQQFNLQPEEYPEAIMPVPLHKKRLRQRGFNQADWLARHIANKLQIHFDRHTLLRQRATAAQHDLPRQQRLKNLNNAFAVKPGKHYQQVVIVDDVMTTGTTANELAATLKKSGVERVDIWAIARAVEHHDE